MYVTQGPKKKLCMQHRKQSYRSEIQNDKFEICNYGFSSSSMILPALKTISSNGKSRKNKTSPKYVHFPASIHKQKAKKLFDISKGFHISQNKENNRKQFNIDIDSQISPKISM
ncbi:hypothetical protein PRUPE_2G017400 [Prunus persica]|uniref:Uncharacterized protein n=1 Tax=Prunus persica TaxID=3760 RepID=A0A251QAP4_PRUPE|nr:hypothetical protein PRUPE_2G017400 [Prunus persica]